MTTRSRHAHREADSEAGKTLSAKHLSSVARCIRANLVSVVLPEHGYEQPLALEHAREPGAEGDSPEDVEVGAAFGLCERIAWLVIAKTRGDETRRREGGRRKGYGANAEG